MLGGLDSPLPKTSPIDVGGKHGATSSVIRWDLHLLLLSPPPSTCSVLLPWVSLGVLAGGALWLPMACISGHGSPRSEVPMGGPTPEGAPQTSGCGFPVPKMLGRLFVLHSSRQMIPCPAGLRTSSQTSPQGTRSRYVTLARLSLLAQCFLYTEQSGNETRVQTVGILCLLWFCT